MNSKQIIFLQICRAIFLICAVSIGDLSNKVRADDESEKGKWIPISTDVTDSIVSAGKKIGYPGLTAGVAVDRTTGDVFMVVCDQGLWKSSDQGKTFARVDGDTIHGRCETSFALVTNPAGKGLAAFMVYGRGATTHDSGTTWMAWKGGGHVDCGAVDWEDTANVFLTIRHESGGVLALSTDGGQSWSDLGKGFRNGVGLFDATTMVATKGDGILRSEDGGKTWSAVSDAKTTGGTMMVWKGIGYWTTTKGVLVSRDKGKTWAVQGTPIAAALGPYFGKDENHWVVGAKEGLMETTDGGKTWNLAAPFPPGFGFQLSSANFANYGFDPVNNIFYASSMGKPTYRWRR